MKLTKREYTMLRWAVTHAEQWRGSMRPSEWKEFDAWIKECKRILKKISPYMKGDNHTK